MYSNLPCEMLYVNNKSDTCVKPSTTYDLVVSNAVCVLLQSRYGFLLLLLLLWTHLLFVTPVRVVCDASSIPIYEMRSTYEYKHLWPKPSDITYLTLIHAKTRIIFWNWSPEDRFQIICKSSSDGFVLEYSMFLAIKFVGSLFFSDLVWMYVSRVANSWNELRHSL